MTKKNFTFSIVIAVYNTEKYLIDAIESVINQTFDFNKVQIILVDDGSSDASIDICIEYKNKYPDNVVYIRQNNAGQSNARNHGLNYVKGTYVNFLDSDDKLSLNALQEVEKFFKKYDNLIDVVVIPRHFFDAKTGEHYLNYKCEPTRVVDIEKEFDFPQTAINCAFIRYTSLTDKFEPEVVISEDSLLINKTILKKSKYGVISNAKYLYRQRNEQNSTIDTKKITYEYFIPRMEYYFKELIEYSLKKKGFVIKYIQNVLMYDLQWYFLDNTHYILNDSQKTKFYNYLRYVLRYIQDDIIFSQKFLDKYSQYACIKFKYNYPKLNIKQDDNNLKLYYKNKILDSLNENYFSINKVKLINNLVYIEFSFNFCLENVLIKIYSKENILKITKKLIDTPKLNQLNYGEFYIIIDLNEIDDDIYFSIYYNYTEYPIKIINNSLNDDILIDYNKLIINSLCNFN